MKETNELVPKDDFGVFAGADKTVKVDSLYVAWVFDKMHKNVLRDIEKLTVPGSGLSEEFIRLNFEPIDYKDSKGRTQKAYAMTKDGFTMLAMGYTGTTAIRFKEQYIRRFNEMEAFVRELASAKQDFPLLTDSIKLAHKNPKSYHFSRECDLINQVALGMTAAEFRMENGIEKGESIRPHLSKKQLAMIDRLQKIDSGLLVGISDYDQRKKLLEWYKGKITGKI